MCKNGSVFAGLLLVFIFSLLHSVTFGQQTPLQIADLQKSFLAKITKSDLQLLLKDASPETQKRFEEPEWRQQQIQSLKEILAMGSEAIKEGLVTDNVLNRLNDLQIDMTAIEYDKKINKSQTPFSLITR